MTESDGCIYVIEASIKEELDQHFSKSAFGYGRDIEEARAHAGFETVKPKQENFDRVIVSNNPEGDDNRSKSICEDICDFHIYYDENLPIEIKKNLNQLIDKKLFADAVRYCFDYVWDNVELD